MDSSRRRRTARAFDARGADDAEAVGDGARADVESSLPPRITQAHCRQRPLRVDDDARRAIVSGTASVLSLRGSSARWSRCRRLAADVVLLRRSSVDGRSSTA